jgi:catechol 2,3-dioxygenase-like lactoylglutathione lyase family enzyme
MAPQEAAGCEVLIGVCDGVAGDAELPSQTARRRQSCALIQAPGRDRRPDFDRELFPERRPGSPIQADRQGIQLRRVFHEGVKMALVVVGPLRYMIRGHRRLHMTITGGMPTIFVSDMDAAVRFYTETLGLKLVKRYGNHFASIDAGHGVTIGLHPASAKNPAGQAGSITLGFVSSEPIRDTVARLKTRGVMFLSDVLDDAQLLLAHFQDADGNPLYLAEMKSTERHASAVVFCG